MSFLKVVPFALALSVTGSFATHVFANPPSTYNAVTATTVIAKPSVTDSGAFDLNLSHCPTHGAGYIFTPTDFYCPIVRVTDANTRPGHSFFGPGSWMAQGWNINSSMFYITDDGNNTYVYNFTPYNMAISQLAGTFSGLTDWDTNYANLAYGKQGTKISQWDFSTTPATVTTIVDVASLITGITELYEVHPSDGTGHGGSTSLKFIAVTGGNGTQGTDFEVLWYNKATGTGFIYNTLTGVIKDTSGNTITSGITSTFYIHQGSITKDGRYVYITNQGAPVSGSGGPYIWDTTTNTVTAMGAFPLSSKPGGHDALGWSEMLNDVYDSANTYFWYRQVDTVTHMQTPINLVANVPSTMLGYDDHPCWNQPQNGSVNTDWLPFFSSTIQASGTYNQSPNYWSDEIIGVATEDRSGAGVNTVWRFAHHRSTITAHPTQDDYYANAWPNISQDGQWAMFQSNWEETLGLRSNGTTFRDDVFIVKLKQSAH